MVARKGYKLTEVGEIPADWEVVALGPHICIGNGSSPSALTFKESGIPYFKVEQLNSSGNILGDTPYFVSFNAPSPAKSIVFPKRGASIFLNRIKLSIVPFYFDTNIMSFYISDCFDYIFIFYQLQKKELWRIADTTSIPQINNKHLKPLVLAVPKNKQEQTAIATALSDADALVDALEQCIAKKRHIKQGAMQELLTGKRRLPGFEGEWTLKCLGNIGYFLKGRGITREEASCGDIPCIRYGEIYTYHTEIIKSFNSYISDKVALNATPLQYGDILFACSGETKEEIGKSVAFTKNIVAYAGGDIIILRSPKANSYFLGYALNTQSLARQKACRGQGDAVVHINSQALGDIELQLPPTLAEQTAIAAVLTAMDDEIAALEAKLSKARQIKAGMMQELLTGRTRLV